MEKFNPDAVFSASAAYHPDWIKSGVSGGANPLWLTEWLAGVLELKPGMRVLDLGCGKALSSIFLHREFGVQVWATDLWFSPDENFQRIKDAGMDSAIFPLHADARSLPFAAGFFDAIISIDSFPYYGTDDFYLRNLARFVKPGGQIAMAGAGLLKEIEILPAHLKEWWVPELYCLHSPEWWKRHWERSGVVDVEQADAMPDGWRFWRDWHLYVAPENKVEIEALEADAGEYLGYTRIVAKRKHDVIIEDPISSIPGEYVRQSLLKG
jgi:SAM-dependent methyltransferase